jgi:ABC-type branched-subunit amino acid transport system substrate-binding protein
VDDTGDSRTSEGWATNSLSRREFLRIAGLAGATIGLGGGLASLVSGCGEETTATTAAAATTATAASASTQVSVGAQALKVGMIYDNSFPLTVKWKDEMDALIPDLNSKGGLTLGNGQKYTVEIVAYDSKRDSETSRSAVQRLLSKDKVSFILGDESADYWVPLTEAAKIPVVFAGSSPTPIKPENKYTFQSSATNTQTSAAYGWVCENKPFKTLCMAQPDNVGGHADAAHITAMAELYGQEVVKGTFYDPATTDFSAIATALINTGAEVFITSGGGPVSDCQLYKAMHQGQFKGFCFATFPWSVGQMSFIVEPENFENVVTILSDTDNPTPSPAAKEFMDIYTAKYGTWDYPYSLHVSSWYLLKAALEKSQSLDADAVKAAIETPLDFALPECHVKMIPRPDLGTQRACDVLWCGTIAQIKGAEYEVLGQISFDQSYAYNKKAYNWQ